MTTNIAAERGDFFQRVSGVLAQARKDSQPENRTPLRRNSRRGDRAKHHFGAARHGRKSRRSSRLPNAMS